MAQVVRAALLQTAWTGDKESMIRVHEDKVREAASAGAQVMCFQELFYGPYFCQVQDEVWFEYAESVPGPTVERFQQLATTAAWCSSSPCTSASKRACSTTPRR